MQHGWAVIAVALAYFGLLFALAAYGDRIRPAWMAGWGRPYIYSFSIAVYCTSWTFFGSVGLATSTGLDFIGLYMGPILAFTLASPLMMKVARLAKAQNITSTADFLAARYGKNQTLAVIVSLAAIVGAIPYIALQLKAISCSVLTVLETYGTPAGLTEPTVIGFWVALVLAIFAGLFGTRHIDATEHQPGLMLAIATESFIKLLAFLAVGIFVTWVMFGGIGDLVQQAQETQLLGRFQNTPHLSTLITFTVLSFACVFLLPRQFHVAVVENRGETDIRHATWLVPLYMVAINIFVFPLALAGMLVFGDGPVSSDMYVLTLPMSAGSHIFTMAAFVGGLSAATAMVIVETVALAIMASNNIAIPLLLRSRESGFGDMRGFLLLVRRGAILLILALAYLYYRNASEAGLAQIGLLSFAAIAQLAPSFFGGLFWRRASGQGAIIGLLTGLAIWTYTLLLPSIAHDGLMAALVLDSGLFGLDWLKPTELFGLKADPLVHGVFWSLTLNTLAYVLGSLTSTRSPMERMQAAAFVGRHDFDAISSSFRGWHTPVRVGELQSTVARYVGEDRTRRAFEEFATARNARPSLFDEADIHMIRYAEHLLTSVIGTSSSRLVLSLFLRRGAVTKKAALRLLDEASVAVQHSRDLLQTALDHARHGVAVYDKDLRLVCWNREFVRIFDHPENLLRVGTPLEEVIRSNAERGLYGPGNMDDIVAERMDNTISKYRTFRSTLLNSGRVVEIRTDDIPDGGLVATFTDVTETVVTERALEARVNERTRELTHLNQELARAKAEADSASYSKTRFLAAASHDILQPLNAARLYVASLAERTHSALNTELVANVDASLQSVEEIFSVLLDISRLDAGAFAPEVTTFKLGDVLRQLEVEFLPLSREKKVDLRIVGCEIWVRSDRRLLRRLLQNLLSNAIKYTPQGSVLMGVRRRQGQRVRIEVWDTGLGIPAASQRVIFKEFQRLDSGARVARGLGLGLSIVERVARILDHPLTLKSAPGKGSVFSVEVPMTAPEETVADVRRTVPASLLSGTRVLCIDNEPAILDGMKHLLGGWGCKVMAAATLGDALTALELEGAPDMIIADYHLDGGDGLSAIQELRSRIAGDVPGILITADRGQNVRAGAKAQGLEVLHKPLRPAALRALLAQLRVARPAAE